MATTKPTEPTKPEPEAKPTGPSADDLKREQDKGGKPDPVGKPVEPVKSEPVDIPANEPYPTGGKK